MSNFKLRPMLGAQDIVSEENRHKLRFPLWGSFKLDGIRSLDHPSGMLSRSLKPIRSAFAQTFCIERLWGVDGELIYGEPTHPQVFNRTTSAVMTIGAKDPLTYYLFDMFWAPEWASCTPYHMRYERLRNLVTIHDFPFLKVVEQVPLKNWDDVLEFEQYALYTGYEGVILRDPNLPYKYNRSTFKEHYLLKLKRLVDSEAVIIGFVEKMRNDNEAVIDALGYQKRSASKEGKVGAGTMGTLMVRDINDGVEFEVGTGFDDVLRDEIWQNREKYLGKTITYRHFPIGRIDKPRQPSFKGFRHEEDMS